MIGEIKEADGCFWMLTENGWEHVSMPCWRAHNSYISKRNFRIQTIPKMVEKLGDQTDYFWSDMPEVRFMVYDKDKNLIPIEPLIPAQGSFDFLGGEINNMDTVEAITVERYKRRGWKIVAMESTLTKDILQGDITLVAHRNNGDDTPIQVKIIETEDGPLLLYKDND
jgi:hypothetical protein